MPLSWILKNREKLEKQGKRFLSVFFVFICFSNKNYLRRQICRLNSTVGTDPQVRPRGQIACGRTQGPSLPNVRMNPTERSLLSWILKNREKQEKQETRLFELLRN